MYWRVGMTRIPHGKIYNHFLYFTRFPRKCYSLEGDFKKKSEKNSDFFDVLNFVE